MAGRPSGEKTRCGGRWTEAKFVSFIKNNLRRASMKWAPISEALKNARIKRGVYLCAGCHKEVPASRKEGRKRVKNVHVDHIEPVVVPWIGFQGWDVLVDRLFCEIKNLQVLCSKCHDIKSQQEKDIAKARRAQEKINGGK